MNLRPLQSTLLSLTLVFAAPVYATYINIFNFEGESTQSAQFATYATLGDMLIDDNRLNLFSPVSQAGQNIIGSAGFVAGDDTPIPTPATLALVGLGLAGLGFTSRRKTRIRRTLLFKWK